MPAVNDETIGLIVVDAENLDTANNPADLNQFLFKKILFG